VTAGKSPLGRFMPIVPVIFSALLAATVGGQSLGPSFDLVIANGRVIDPESGLDGSRHVGIRGGRIASISRERLSGRSMVDARGLVVAPGFIDVHAHGQTAETYAFQALDGVTTALELEVGTADVDAWYAERRGGRLINYGVSIGHIPVRMSVLHDPGTFLPSGDGAHRAASPDEVSEILRRLDDGLARGAVAMGAGLPYTEAATAEELSKVFGLAGKRRVPVHVHIRPGVDGLREALGLAGRSGAPLHVVHLNSAGTTSTPEMLRMIQTARRQGRDVTTEAYPYDAGMTEIRSAILDQYENAPDEKFAELEWPRTGEHLTRESFARYRALGGPVIRRTNTAAMVDLAVTSPLTMIASDAYWENGTGHPRTTGTSAKVLGRYVRELGSLRLMEALRKLTLMPAERLQTRVSSMRRKGRLRVGADADITMFDPARVIDRSTYREPSLPPDGIPYVIVNGVLVVRDGKVVSGVSPGRAVRAAAGATP
jgi:N-acyl-D-aspartate/D-glutamate deacylase